MDGMTNGMSGDRAALHITDEPEGYPRRVGDEALRMLTLCEWPNEDSLGAIAQGLIPARSRRSSGAGDYLMKLMPALLTGAFWSPVGALTIRYSGDAVIEFASRPSVATATAARTLHQVVERAAKR